jgi:cyanophycinase
MLAVIRAHPQLLGLGIDEGTALVVHGDEFEVLGRSSVLVYGAKGPVKDGRPYLLLSKGDKFNLATRGKRQAADYVAAKKYLWAIRKE